MNPRLRLVATSVVVALVLAVASTVALRAGDVATSVSPEQPKSPEPLIVEVKDGVLRDEATMSVVFEWATTLTVTTPIAGTVTETMPAGGLPVEIAAGQTVYRLDEHPVVVMQGLVPAFRDLRSGMTGRDVEQLQSFLAGIGLYTGEVDGTWRSDTSKAVRLWQRLHQVEETLVLPFGSLLFLPALPALVKFADGVRVGAMLSPGDAAIDIVSDLPSARLVVPPSMTGPVGATKILATVGDDRVSLESIGEATTDPETSEISIELKQTSPSGCPSWCKSLDTDRPTRVSATVTLAGPVSGPIVPLGALATDGDEVRATMADGSSRRVSILIQIGGEAVVEGLSAGDQIVVP